MTYHGADHFPDRRASPPDPRPFDCASCGHGTPGDMGAECEVCEKEFCDECTEQCELCDKVLCPECAAKHKEQIVEWDCWPAFRKEQQP